MKSKKQKKEKPRSWPSIKDFTLVVPYQQIEAFYKERKKRKYFVPCILWAEVEMKLGKQEFKRFTKWMTGQTCLQEGVYVGDLDIYLRARSKGIKDPYVWD